MTQTKKHQGDHRVVTPLTDEQLMHASTWLPALENDTVEAQYLFTKKSVAAILNCLKKNNIRLVVECLLRLVEFYWLGSLLIVPMEKSREISLPKV